MDGALRAYANRMAVLGLICGVLAVASLGLFAYVRLQRPVVIRVDQTGEATVEPTSIRAAADETPPVAARVPTATAVPPTNLIASRRENRSLISSPFHPSEQRGPTERRERPHSTDRRAEARSTADG
jgi:hypothetical protein